MIALTGYTIADYLINRKFISRHEFLHGECIIKENFFRSTRNANFVINRKNAPPLFVKQPRSFNQVEGGLRQEIQFYQQFGTSLAQKKVGLFPKQHSDKYDEINQILIFDFLKKTYDYNDLITSRYLVPAGEILTQRSGRQLANAHALTAKSELPTRHPFRCIMPWLLTVQKFYLTQLAGSDEVSVARLGRWLLKNVRILDRLAEDWNESHVIHGDLHWQNLLVIDADPNTPDLLLIDWEFAALGDPFWDVATLLSDYLIQSVSTNMQIIPDRLPVLMKTLATAYISQPDDASCQRIIQLTGLATIQQYGNWIINKTLPLFIKDDELFEQARHYLTRSDDVLKTWNTL